MLARRRRPGAQHWWIDRRQHRVHAGSRLVRITLTAGHAYRFDLEGLDSGQGRGPIRSCGCSTTLAASSSPISTLVPAETHKSSSRQYRSRSACRCRTHQRGHSAESNNVPLDVGAKTICEFRPVPVSKSETSWLPELSSTRRNGSAHVPGHCRAPRDRTGRHAQQST